MCNSAALSTTERTDRRRLAGWCAAFAVVCAVWALGARAQQEWLQDFENQDEGSFPEEWVSTSTRPILPATVAAPGAHGSSRSLLLGPSSPRLHTGASIWRELPAAPALVIEFSLAFGGGAGRGMRLWTTTEDGTAPTQLHLSLENRRLRQFHPQFHEWVDLGVELTESPDPENPVWQRVRLAAGRSRSSVDVWVSPPETREFSDGPTATLPAYRTGFDLKRIHMVVEGTEGKPFVRLDDVLVRAAADASTAPESEWTPEEYHRLWSGPPIPENQEEIQRLASVHHVVIHAPKDGTYTFLHGAAIVHHKGLMYANWANSPTHENSPDETLQGATSTDSGQTWSSRYVVAKAPDGEPNYSHAVYLSRKDGLWTFAARFRGLLQTPGLKFPDLQVEALVLDEEAGKWISRGTVGREMWPYVEPIRLPNGNWITAGQDNFGKPGVLISRGEDLTDWRTIRIPVSPDMPQGFGETALLPISGGGEILALVRPGGTKVAWASVSRDNGETWTPTRRTNYPAGLSKIYAGRLSTGQPYIVANLPSRGNFDRDTLAIGVGRAGEDTIRRIYQIRFGPTRPVYPGFAKGSQWSYPYAHESDGKLYVVYSINKEDCGLSIIPLTALTAE